MSLDAQEASAQLQTDLTESIANAYTARRPILTHLNADTTWLLSIPYPNDSTPPSGRCRYNILVDPWLQGPQTDVAGWFSIQWHVIKSSVDTIAELDVLLKDAEKLEMECAGSNGRIDAEPSLKYASSGQQTDNEPSLKTYVDLVVISHEFTDHCHKNTLLEVDPRVPVFATAKAVQLISSWSHFETVVNIPLFGEKHDWRKGSIPPLPKWLGVSRLVTKSDALYFHSAVVICIQKPNSDCAEAVVYTPHGVEAATFSSFESARPTVSTLAFLHGLHNVSISVAKQLNLGAHNALKAQRLLHSKYWIGTHDEDKKSSGIIAPFLKRKTHTVLDALASESRLIQNGEVTDKQILSDVSYVGLGSGESLLLT